jgi:hypothetical protein
VRLIELLAIVAFLGGAGVIARAAWRAAAGARTAAQDESWEPYHRYEGECRKVYVRRGEELEPVGEVVPSDADYDATFLRLMDRARERAAVLNSER